MKNAPGHRSQTDDRELALCPAQPSKVETVLRGIKAGRLSVWAVALDQQRGVRAIVRQGYSHVEREVL